MAGEKVQEQLTLAAVDRGLSVLDQLRGLATDHVWAVLAVVFLGSVVGIAAAGGRRLFGCRLDADLPAKEYANRVLTLKQWAWGASALWTTAFLIFFIDASLVLRLLMAPALGLISALAAPYTFDLLKWLVTVAIPTVGKAALSWVMNYLKGLLTKKPKESPP